MILAFLKLLFTPRRSFAFRQLERERDELKAERDDFRDRWIKAMNYAQVISRQPKYSAIEDKQLPPREKPLTAVEIEEAHQRQHDEEFEAWLAAERARESTGAPNDVDPLVS